MPSGARDPGRCGREAQNRRRAWARTTGPHDDPRDELTRTSDRRDFRLCPGRRLSRRAEGEAQAAGGLHGARGSARDVKVFVDTAPVMEKPLAQEAGLGWQGKHTNLVSRANSARGCFSVRCSRRWRSSPTRRKRSLRRNAGAASTSARPTPSPRPTASMRGAAFPISPSSTRGISPREFREAIGNRIYGCDDCLAVCPWNKFAQTAREARFQARAELRAPPLAELARLDDAAFPRAVPRLADQAHRPRPLRAQCADRHRQFGRAALAPEAERLLDDPSPLVRAMAVWALSQILDRHSFAALANNTKGLSPNLMSRRKWAGS